MISSATQRIRQLHGLAHGVAIQVELPGLGHRRDFQRAGYCDTNFHSVSHLLKEDCQWPPVQFPDQTGKIIYSKALYATLLLIAISQLRLLLKSDLFEV
ncbi:MAG: hypothetical protein WDA10_03930 [Porticoccaceae bacterium]